MWEKYKKTVTKSPFIGKPDRNGDRGRRFYQTFYYLTLQVTWKQINTLFTAMQLDWQVRREESRVDAAESDFTDWKKETSVSLQRRWVEPPHLWKASLCGKKQQQLNPVPLHFHLVCVSVFFAGRKLLLLILLHLLDHRFFHWTLIWLPLTQQNIGSILEDF